MAKQWHYSKGNQKLGPVPDAELRKMAADGRLSPEDMIWSEGMTDWVPARTAKGLFPASDAPPPLPKAAAVPQPDTKREARPKRSTQRHGRIASRAKPTPVWVKGAAGAGVLAVVLAAAVMLGGGDGGQSTPPTRTHSRTPGPRRAAPAPTRIPVGEPAARPASGPPPAAAPQVDFSGSWKVVDSGLVVGLLAQGRMETWHATQWRGNTYLAAERPNTVERWVPVREPLGVRIGGGQTLVLRNDGALVGETIEDFTFVYVRLQGVGRLTQLQRSWRAEKVRGNPAPGSPVGEWTGTFRHDIGAGQTGKENASARFHGDGVSEWLIEKVGYTRSTYWQVREGRWRMNGDVLTVSYARGAPDRWRVQFDGNDACTFIDAGKGNRTALARADTRFARPSSKTGGGEPRTSLAGVWQGKTRNADGSTIEMMVGIAAGSRCTYRAKLTQKNGKTSYARALGRWSLHNDRLLVLSSVDPRDRDVGMGEFRFTIAGDVAAAFEAKDAAGRAWTFRKTHDAKGAETFVKETEAMKRGR